jgi:hypothetical protein
MLDLLARVSEALTARGVPHALIGASALAVHGVSRSTVDVDLLATARSVLDAASWRPLGESGVRVDVRVGDDQDPLAGLVRFDAPGQRTVDVVVGKHAWQAEVVRDATETSFGATRLRVATAPDLVLLKLYAGSPHDAWDVEQLLLAGDREAIAAQVETRLDRLPPDAAALWRRIVRPVG